MSRTADPPGLEQRIQALVDAAPPLTEGQRRRLALLLNPAAIPAFSQHEKAAPARHAKTATTPKEGTQSQCQTLSA